VGLDALGPKLRLERLKERLLLAHLSGLYLVMEGEGDEGAGGFACVPLHGV
jgi:hypothetical protein